MKYYIMLLFAGILVVSTTAQPTIQWQRSLGGTDKDGSVGINQTIDGGFLMTGYSSSTDGDITDNKGDSDIWLAKLTALGATQWTKSLGGSSYEFPSYQNAVLTSDGGIVLGGQTSSQDGDVSFNHGKSELWLIKLDSTGAIVWEKTYGGNGEELISEFHQTSDGGFILIGFTWSDQGVFSSNHGESDAYVVKTDAQGNVEWQKLYGGSMGEFGGRARIVQTPDGGYFFSVLTLSSDGDVSPNNHGSIDFWSVRIDSVGNILWERVLGGSKNEFLTQIFATTEGGFIVAGSTASNDGDVSTHVGNASNAWVIKLDAEGYTEWDNDYGGSTGELLDQMLATPDGGYIMTCQSFSTDGDITDSHSNGLYIEVWVAKIDAGGTIQWQRALGGYDDERFGQLALTPDGGYLMTSYTYSNDGDVSGYKGEADVWLVKLNNAGVLQWQKTFGGTNTEYPTQNPLVTSDNGILLTNLTFSNDGDVTGFHGPAGKEDVWMVKLNPETVAVNDVNSASAGLQLAPNPASEFVIVSINTPETSLSVTIADVLGREMSRQTILNGGRLAVSSLPDGMYRVITTSCTGMVYTSGFVKN